MFASSRRCSSRPSRTFLLPLIIVMGLASVLSACGSSGNPAQPEVSATDSNRLPSETLEDVVTYSEGVVTVKVDSEEQQEISPVDQENGEGLVGRDVTVTVVSVVWRRPDGRRLPTTLTFATDGWALQDGELVTMRSTEGSRLEVGSTYLMPLAEFVDGLWGPMSSKTTLRVSEGRPRADHPAGAFSSLSGRPLEEFAAALSDQRPDPAAIEFMSLPADERLRETWTSTGRWEEDNSK